MEPPNLDVRSVAPLLVLPTYPTGNLPRTVFHRTRAQALARAGCNVIVVAPTPETRYPFVGKRMRTRWGMPEHEPHHELDGDVQVFRPRYLAHSGQIRYGLPGSLQAFAIRDFGDQPITVVHSQGAYPTGHAARAVARRADVPFVLGLHGSDTNVYPYLNALARQRFRGVARSADAVIAVSDALAARATEIADVKATVVRTGIEIDRFASAMPVSPSDLGVPDGHRIVLFVGAITPAKGIDVLLQSMNILSEDRIRFVFVGTGLLEVEVSKAPNSVVLGPAPNSAIPSLLKAADLLVLPSRNEGLPNVVVEAGAAGTPVVASSAGGLRSLLADDRGFLLDSVTPMHLAETIRHALNDDLLASQRACLLARYVSEFYDIDRNAAILRSLYVRLGADS